MADEAKGIHVRQCVRVLPSMARPRGKSHRPFTHEASGLAGERANSSGAAAPKATAPVRECGVKYQVSWARRICRQEDKDFPHMKHRNAFKTVVASVAIVLSLTLSGCDLPFELPFDLDGILAPIDEFLTPTSVQEAQDAQRASRNPAVTAPAIHEDGVLVVGIRSHESIPPMVIASGNALSGIDIDVASAIADQMGLSVRFVEVTDIDEALASSCDIVMGVETGESSRATVVGTYVETATALYGPTGSAGVTAADLAGATVGVQDGSVSQRLLSTSNASMTEIPFANLNDAFDALKAGSVNYVLCDAYPGAYLASVYGGIEFVGTLDVCSPIGIAVAADNTTLQTSVQSAYDSLNSGGVVGLIRSKWVGGLSAITPDNQVEGIQLFDTPGAAAVASASAPTDDLTGTWTGSVETSSGTEAYFELTLEADGTVTFIPVDAHYYEFYNQDGTWELDGTTVNLHLSRGDKTLEVDGSSLVGVGSEYGVSAYDTVTFTR